MQVTVDVANGCATVNYIGAIFLRVNILTGDKHVGSELPDDFFQDIFQRHQANHITVFIDHNGDAALLLLEVE